MKHGRIYNGDESGEYQIDVKHKFHKDDETFEIYECPNCNGHFLVESEAVSSVDVMYCPYCKFEFKGSEE